MVRPAFEAALALAQAVLPGVVGAVGKPQAEAVAVDLGHDLAAFEDVVERLLLDAGVRIAQRAEAVLVILEDVGVDRADVDALRLGVLAHGGVVVVLRLVPRNVDGDGGRDAGHLVDHGGVVQLLPAWSRRRRARRRP